MKKEDAYTKRKLNLIRARLWVQAYETASKSNAQTENPVKSDPGLIADGALALFDEKFCKPEAESDASIPKPDLAMQVKLIKH